MPIGSVTVGETTSRYPDHGFCCPSQHAETAVVMNKRRRRRHWRQKLWSHLPPRMEWLQAVGNPWAICFVKHDVGGRGPPVQCKLE